MGAHSPLSRQSGFTLIELLVVIAVIAVIAAAAIPVFFGQRAKAVQTDCLTTRAHADRAQVIYTLEHGTHTDDFADLISEGLIDSAPVCPSGGILSWTQEGSLYRLDCSAHGQAASATSLTSLGSTFSDISGGLIRLIDDFYRNHGHYPRSWGDHAWEDIGLDPADWENPADNLIYKPVGNRITVTPAAGYAIEVQATDGTTRVLTSRLNWSLVYSLDTKQWYYHSIHPDNEISISTMNVHQQ
ncbi:MAG: prepilin-type N-terminal cleavage/methylation domain-containing protein [Actinobacteria bacterium]|nr:prepilin-type N-terminal cleavage/methylation domain-containing protein [Actinomycetota bacterium]